MESVTKIYDREGFGSNRDELEFCERASGHFQFYFVRFWEFMDRKVTRNDDGFIR